MFSNDTDNLVIKPIEAMITLVSGIAKNPLDAAKEEGKEAED